MPSNKNLRNTPPFFDENEIAIPSKREMSILGLTMIRGGLAQPQIIEETGLPQQTVSRLVKGLIIKGMLREEQRISRGRRGQPSMFVMVEPEFAYSFGVAMMTDALSVVLMDFAGNVLHEELMAMPSMSQRAVLEKLEETFERSLAACNVDPERVVGIGVGISGYTFGNGARFNTPRQLDEWALIDIDDVIRSHLKLPVWVENDGNAAAIGESLVGVGRTYNNFAYLFIAAGVGGGIIANHQLLRGFNGNAGEVGLILPSQIYPHPNIEILRQIITRNGVEVDGLTDMLERFDLDWPGVDDWISKTRDSLSLIISALAAILDPEAIVLGGRIPRELAHKMIPHVEVYDHYRRAEPRPMPRIILGESPGDACAIGASMLPFKQFFFSGL